MDDDQQFCLRWNNHQSTLISVFDTLLENETLVDCTLAAEGKFLKAHKVVLSACSPYFATLLQEQYDKHPIFILKDVKYQELRAMMDYMYRGEVNISQDQLAALLKAAESLQIKGLSDNRTGGGSAPKPESSGQQHHRGGKLSGAYTLEQTKRARLATGGAMDASGDVSGSREGSSSPSRRRRKVRRRSMENDAHDNSNSSVLQAAASNQSILQQTGAGLAVSALVTTQLASGPAAGTSSQASSTQQQQPLTSTNVTKKTESAKLTSSTAAPASGASASAAAVQQAHLQQAQATSDAINTENVQAQSQGGAQGVQGDDDDMDEGSVIGGSSAASGPNPASASASAVHAGVVVKQLASVVDKSSSNHKQKIKDNSVSSVGSDMVIEPKAEYDDDAHDENVEDLTLDEEDMTMEELDQTAGTSQGGEGSSQTYAWQHDRSQDELGLMAQDAQQRDPQVTSVERKYNLRIQENSCSSLDYPSTSRQKVIRDRKTVSPASETISLDQKSENEEPSDVDSAASLKKAMANSDAMIALQQLASISTARSLQHLVQNMTNIDNSALIPGRKLPRQAAKRSPKYESNRCPLCSRVCRSQAFLNEHMRKEHSVLI
ncbi:longitudinals lacking protein, isoforms H/M/V isoform X13 [Drosophila eugracilis]|uniref:longitudinals lacking protein, isoforms H/M/V isoform X13 n=1 Tax=Drosophila eugracilis TaxID=29029 RepID=UPI0007E833BC|nr:longitudinals lacking protein, isoforms H/M/V isoform X13 [Drosophila eugracilis]